MRRSHYIFVFYLMAAVPAAAEPVALTILHTNDLQGKLLPAPYYDAGERGGLARILHLLEQQSRDNATLILDGGDALGAAALSRFDAGRTVAELMAKAGYAAVATGNHEFDYGPDTLSTRASLLPILSANCRRTGKTDPFLRSHLVVERAGLRVAVIGLSSPGMSHVINPLLNAGVEFAPVDSVLGAILDSVASQVDYTVALVHMPEAEVRALSNRFPAVDLFVAGGFDRPQLPGHFANLIQHTGGSRIVSTPGWGAFVGHVDLVLSREGAQTRELEFRSRLIPVRSSAPEEPYAADRIRRLRQAFDQAQSVVVGHSTEPIREPAALIAELMRSRLASEVALLNRGTLRSGVVLGEAITTADIDRLIRYDDVLVKGPITGARLRQIATSSQAREKASQHLVFAGYDPERDEVNGRKLQRDEVYAVSTTAFLAAGGDGYFGDGEIAPAAAGEDWVTLKEIVVDHVRAGAPSSPAGTTAAGAVWKNHTKLSGSVSRTSIDAQAPRYGGVSFLSGKNAMTWNSLLDSEVKRESGKGTYVTRFRSSFGQVRSDRAFREAVDRIQLEQVYTWHRERAAPFVALDLNTVWTGNSGESRPLALRGSSGLQRQLGEGGKVRVGLAVERNFASKSSEVGLEIAPEYRRPLPQNSAVSSSLKLFAGATRTRSLSTQAYNTLLINLAGGIHLTVDANLFAHRDSDVDAVAVKTELQIGLGYTWRQKWL